MGIIMKYVILCAIWYHLYNFKNVKNTHGGVLLLVKCRVQLANLLKVTLLHGCFARFKNVFIVRMAPNRAKCLIWNIQREIFTTISFFCNSPQIAICFFFLIISTFYHSNVRNGNSQQIVWVCFTILLVWHLKG